MKRSQSFKFQHVCTLSERISSLCDGSFLCRKIVSIRAGFQGSFEEKSRRRTYVYCISLSLMHLETKDKSECHLFFENWIKEMVPSKQTFQFIYLRQKHFPYSITLIECLKTRFEKEQNCKYSQTW